MSYHSMTWCGSWNSSLSFRQVHKVSLTQKQGETMEKILLLLLAAACCFAGGCDETGVANCSDEISAYIEQMEEELEAMPPENSSSCAQCGSDCGLRLTYCRSGCWEAYWNDPSKYITCKQKCSDVYDSCMTACDWQTSNVLSRPDLWLKNTRQIARSVTRRFHLKRIRIGYDNVEVSELGKSQE